MTLSYKSVLLYNCKIILILLTCLCATGCATIINGSYQIVEIRNNENYELRVVNRSGLCVATSISPCVVRLKRGDGLFRREKYKIIYYSDGVAIREQKLKTVLNPWVLGNVLLYYGVAAVIIDGYTGAMWKIKEVR